MKSLAAALATAALVIAPFAASQAVAQTENGDAPSQLTQIGIAVGSAVVLLLIANAIDDNSDSQ